MGSFVQAYDIKCFTLYHNFRQHLLLLQNIFCQHIFRPEFGVKQRLPKEEFLDPILSGHYKSDDGHSRPITTKSLPAPEVIIEMVRCTCKKDCSSERYSCRSQKFPCIELCKCDRDCQNDKDCQDITYFIDTDNDTDEDDNLQCSV